MLSESDLSAPNVRVLSSVKEKSGVSVFVPDNSGAWIHRLCVLYGRAYLAWCLIRERISRRVRQIEMHRDNVSVIYNTMLDVLIFAHFGRSKRAANSTDEINTKKKYRCSLFPDILFCIVYYDISLIYYYILFQKKKTKTIKIIPKRFIRLAILFFESHGYLFLINKRTNGGEREVEGKV